MGSWDEALRVLAWDKGRTTVIVAEGSVVAYV